MKASKIARTTGINMALAQYSAKTTITAPASMNNGRCQRAFAVGSMIFPHLEKQSCFHHTHFMCHSLP
jgi:hypothetical protein